jgi:uncharacterized protein (TIGR03437 family)
LIRFWLLTGLIPYEVNPNAPQQLVVQRGYTLSLPSFLNVAPAQPVALGAPGAVIVYPQDGSSPHAASADTPAHVGDTLSLTCVRLGAVNPPVVDGATFDPAAGVPTVASPMQVQIGGDAATVTFQGLSRNSRACTR